MSDSYYACEESFADTRLWTCVGPFNNKDVAQAILDTKFASKTVLLQTNVRLPVIPVILRTKIPNTNVLVVPKLMETEWVAH